MQEQATRLTSHEEENKRGFARAAALLGEHTAHDRPR